MPVGPCPWARLHLTNGAAAVAAVPNCDTFHSSQLGMKGSRDGPSSPVETTRIRPGS